MWLKIKKINRLKLTTAFILVFLGVLFRTVWHIGANIEFVTSSALISAAYLGLGYSIIVPLIIMIVTDFIIGNTNIFIFTWSGYLMIGLAGYLTLREKNSIRKKKKFLTVIKASQVGLFASFWFYLWTNFGVWLLDSFGMYPKNFSGLIQAYIFALPFLKYNLIGNMIIIPVSFAIIELVRSLSIVRKYCQLHFNF